MCELDKSLLQVSIYVYLSPKEIIKKGKIKSKGFFFPSEVMITLR